MSADRVVNLRSLPDDVIETPGNVWLVVGPGWRNYMKWRLQQAFEFEQEIFWMGMGDIGNKVPPSGILEGRKDIQTLLKKWDKEENSNANRILLLEDPLGSGVWNELIRSSIWIEFLSRSKDFNCDVIIGTGSPLSMSRLVIENTDYLLIRCAGDDNIRFLTNGSRLTDWLDAIGRDLFDDIRVYRRIMSLIGSKNRDLIVALTLDADTVPERIFWWDREVRETIDDDYEPSHQSQNTNTHHLVHTHTTSGNNIALKAKVTAAITLLQEILKEL